MSIVCWYRPPLNFSLVDSPFFFRIPYFNLNFFLNMPPLEICCPGPGPLWPVRKYGYDYIAQCGELALEEAMDLP